MQNAIDFARVMGIETPKVAILSAVETVTASIPSTLDAAALCKMADRGQITGGLLDGPLAFDNAVSPDAVQIKGIVSEVAGQADILAVPDLESGNMIAKQLEYLAGASGWEKSRQALRAQTYCQRPVHQISQPPARTRLRLLTVNCYIRSISQKSDRNDR